MTRSIILETASVETTQEPGYDKWLAEFIEISEVVNDEDNALNDLQQAGARSAYARSGRYSHLEASAWHVAPYVRRMIAKHAA